MTGAAVDPAASLAARIGAAAIPRINVEQPLGDGWIAADELAAGAALEAELARVRAWAGTGSAAVAGALFLDAYVWAVAGAAAGGLLLANAVPELRPRDVLVRFGPNGRAAAVGFRGGTLADAQESELLAGYREALVAHLDPLVERLHLTCRRARSAFWRNAGDMTAYTLVWCGRELGAQARGSYLARRLLSGRSPLGPPRAFRLPGREHVERLTCVRHGCCLWLRTANGAVCAGCPVRRAPGRAA